MVIVKDNVQDTELGMRRTFTELPKVMIVERENILAFYNEDHTSSGSVTSLFKTIYIWRYHCAAKCTRTCDSFICAVSGKIFDYRTRQ